MAHEPRRHDPPTAPPSHSPTLQIDEYGIGWLTLDDPERKVNVLTEGVMRRLAELVEEIYRLVSAGQMRALVVWSGKPDSFIVGADVDAIGKINQVRRYCSGQKKRWFKFPYTESLGSSVQRLKPKRRKAKAPIQLLPIRS